MFFPQFLKEIKIQQIQKILLRDNSKDLKARKLHFTCIIADYANIKD